MLIRCLADSNGNSRTRGVERSASSRSTPPFRSGVEREVVLALARIAQEAGVEGLTWSNTRPVADAHLSTGTGGLSGRALSADTPRIVGEVRAATGAEMPVNACGGVFSV